MREGRPRLAAGDARALTCQLGAEARRAYRSLKRNLMVEIDAGEVTAAKRLVKLLRLQQITGGYIRTDDGQECRSTPPKMNLLRDVLEDIDPLEPVIVFCRFHKDLEAVNRVADETGRCSLELSGRMDELQQWQAGEARCWLCRLTPAASASISPGPATRLLLPRAFRSVLRTEPGAYHRPDRRGPSNTSISSRRTRWTSRFMAALARRSDVVNSVLQQMKGQA